MRGMGWSAGLGLALLLGTVASARAQEPSCPALAGRAVEAAAIGLPTGGARIATAVTVGATADGPAHCRLNGRIEPVDPAAPPILFQINLPPASAWNGKLLQYGGGGFNGVLITGLAPLRDAPPGAPTPLAQGYATFGTDSGHQNETLPDIQAFALNEEALTNFAHAAYKKVRDVAVALATQHYRRAPGRVYFFGGSEGGREGLVVAQRYPADYDGVVSAVPVINWVALQLAGNHRSGTVQAEGGWLNPAQVTLLRRAVIEGCDALDGLEDGVISHNAACARVFDPAKLQCPAGTQPGETCLSERQVAALRALRNPFTLPFALANGVRSYPGHFFGGEDQPDGLVAWQTGPQPPAFPLPPPNTQGRAWYYGGGAIRYFILRDANADPRGFDPRPHADRMQALSALMDATNPDLSAFAARGGRLILKQNLSDYAQAPQSSVDYYDSVVARMGRERVDSFLRFYAAPGANHGGRIHSGLDGAAMPSHLDMLALLDAWVERGTPPPDAPVLTAHEPAAPFAVTAQRPICRWPSYPRYRGGDPRQAESFACSTP